jgi:hypothetical protein
MKVPRQRLKVRTIYLLHQFYCINFIWPEIERSFCSFFALYLQILNRRFGSSPRLVPARRQRLGRVGIELGRRHGRRGQRRRKSAHEYETGREEAEHGRGEGR